MASTPAFLSGGGGIDLSVAPLMGFVNIILVTKLFGHPVGSPWLAIPIVLAIGAAVGAVNGTMIAYLRFPPVITTLGMFFVLSGVNLYLVPNPVTVDAAWTDRLADSFGPAAGRTSHDGCAVGPLGSTSAHGVRRITARSGRSRRHRFLSRCERIRHTGRRLRCRRNHRRHRRDRTDGAQCAPPTPKSSATMSFSASPRSRSVARTSPVVEAALSGHCSERRRFHAADAAYALHGSAYFIQFAYGAALFIAVVLGSRVFNTRTTA